MSSNDTTINEKQDQVVLRDLQTILRRSLNEQVTVVNFTTSLLLPKGENYASTMLKVEAVIKREKKSSEENLSLVAKMIPVTEFQKTHFNSTNSFLKEIYVFEKLIPTYKQLEREMGVKNEHVFDILPKFYGGRLTRNEKFSEKADEDAVLLLENLKVRQYYTMDRMYGLDLNHSKVAITALARFHALGRALHVKKPELFKEAEESLNFFPFEMNDEEWQELMAHIFKIICMDSRVTKYKDKVKVLLSQSSKYIKPSIIVEPWVSIIHGDFWVNNIMFQHENGQIKDIKFVDFQLAKACSPLKDLPYFICGSVHTDVMENHMDELLDIYYNKYIEVLDHLGCDTSPYTKKSFEDNLKYEANPELFHCLIAIKFFTIDISEDTDLSDLKSTIFMSEANSLFIERSWKIISMFVKKEWI